MPMIPSAPVEANAARRYVFGLQPGCSRGQRTRLITCTAIGEGVVIDPTVTRALTTGPAKVSPPPKVAAITRPVRVAAPPIALGEQPKSGRTGVEQDGHRRSAADADVRDGPDRGDAPAQVLLGHGDGNRRCRQVGCTLRRGSWRRW